MLSTFRRLIYSKAGAIVTGIVLILIALAFAGGDVSSLRTQGMAALGGDGAVVTVGSVKVTAAEFKQRVQAEMEGYRQQQPTLDMAQFVAGGGFDATLERTINSLALQQFGEQQGMLVSRRAEDGQIASIPGLQGPDGRFDPAMFRQVLAQRKLLESNVRADLRRDMMGGQLTAQLAQARDVPQQLALPYASLSLEKRVGTIGIVPSRAMPAGPAPTEAELQAYYQRSLATFTVPERRVLRIARITPERLRTKATPTEAEIAQAYSADRAKYAATQKRTVSQVVVLDQAGAARIAAQVRGGGTLAAAARAAGLEASTAVGVLEPALAQSSSPAVARAVFAAAKGAVIGPIKAPLGFVVARVDTIDQVAGRTLAQAHDEIAAGLAKQKLVDALNAEHDAIDDALGRGSTFDEVAADRKLDAETTPALLATGVDPTGPAKSDPTLVPLVAAAFQMADGDAPTMVPTGPDGSFAVVGLGRIVPAAPRPFALVRQEVLAGLNADRARLAARKVAGQILARVNGGATIAAAMAAAGVTLPPPHELAASHDDLGRAQGPTRAPLALMFAMARGTAKLLEAPGGAGWAIIKLDRIIPGDAAKSPANVAGVTNAFRQIVGREYAEQFARAARATVGVKTNATALARVRAELLGQAASDR